jgi:TatD DNase family protein
MYIDSHCHLDRLDLAPYRDDFGVFMQHAHQQDIEHLLCISIDWERYPAMRQLIDPYPDISVSVGIHPNEQGGYEPSVEELIQLADEPRVVAIGETGLDYFRSQGDLAWQHQRFIRHIEAALSVDKPLIIHTREAGQDALQVLRAQGAQRVGGVIHCFTEDWDYAQNALELNFYISFSGIVTFKNAASIQEVARRVPADRFLIETDSPYLAPIPHRGKPNYPTYVKHVAEFIAELRAETPQTIARQSGENFRRLFGSTA